MVRLGLCCQFVGQDIKFRTATAKHALSLGRSERLKKISGLCLANAQALLSAIEYCGAHAIGCFRVNSQFFPLKTHPKIGYEPDDLPDAVGIRKMLSACRQKARELNVRLSFHPDQFVLLSSPDAKVVAGSIAELEYQAEVSELIGADVLNIHAGGAYGDKASALKRMGRVLQDLNPAVRSRLTLENDDRIYTPQDLLLFCREHHIPLIYDVHHHRCLPDGLSVAEATEAALKTWDREPLFHISSPRDGWRSNQPAWHHDYIDIKDFPAAWRTLDITVEVEAKAKERAVLRLARDLKTSGGRK